MPRSLSLLALACTLVACSPERSPDSAEPLPPAKPAEAPADRETTERGVTALTLFRGGAEALAGIERASVTMPGYALVARPLQYTLKAGRNASSAAGVPPAMDIEAALLRPKTPGVTIESQRYVAALSGSQDVISQMLGNRVTVEHTAGGAKQTDSGTLLAANDGAPLLPQQTALQWTVAAKTAGPAEFVLSYPMGGMAWRAESLATLAKGADCLLTLDGAALVANRSGVTFSQTSLTLVAGRASRARCAT